MNANENRLRAALTKIAEVARSVVDGEELAESEDGAPDEEETSPSVKLVCTPKALPPRLLHMAAATAVRINPVNAPSISAFSALPPDFQIMEPEHIAVLTTKYWGPTPRRLTVSFMESTPANLRARILSHMNAWTKTGCISFAETAGTGIVRISRGPGDTGRISAPTFSTFRKIARR
jgi:hypothetical protein